MITSEPLVEVAVRQFRNRAIRFLQFRFSTVGRSQGFGRGIQQNQKQNLPAKEASLNFVSLRSLGSGQLSRVEMNALQAPSTAVQTPKGRGVPSFPQTFFTFSIDTADDFVDGILAEVLRNCAISRMCQVNLTDNYEHKHQALLPGNPSRSLGRMACDIAKPLFRTLASEGLVFTGNHFRTLELRYIRMAQDTISRHYADAMLNGLRFDPHAEEAAVAAFAESLRTAQRAFFRIPVDFLSFLHGLSFSNCYSTP
jgi:hypothetical protein